MKKNPVFFLNEPRAWSSYAEIFKTAETPSSASDGYASDQHQSIAIGLGKLYQVLVMLKKENQDPRVAASVQDLIINNRSVVDIAIIGVMISLGETSRYREPITSELLQEIYKEKVEAKYVEDERKRALEALGILLKLKADGAKLAGNADKTSDAAGRKQTKDPRPSFVDF